MIWQLAEPGMAQLAWLALAAWALLWWSRRARARAYRAFFATPSGEAVRLGFVKPVLRGALMLGAILGLVGALARPQWDPTTRTVTASGRDIAVVLDVSRSMLAEDLAPNRLERAKLWVKDLAASVEGDRLALVAFAGGSVVKCPLTMDHGFFTLALDRLDSRSVARGGTYIGDAIRRCLDSVFEDSPGRHRDLILITDGEDQGSMPVEAARLARDRGVRIIALGIGSDLEGSTVPIEDEAGRPVDLTYGGQAVRSKLEGESLKKIATASDGGVYLHVATGNVDLERVYRDLIATADRHETDTTEVTEFREGYQLLLALCLGLLFLEVLIDARPKM